jgi:predicted nucleic acid-binding protein
VPSDGPYQTPKRRGPAGLAELVEAQRVLVRAAARGELTEVDALEAARDLANAASRWTLVEVTPELAERAAQRFPAEPLRTLDAIHLATALYLVARVGAIAVLSVDERVARNAALLGLPLAMPVGA